MFLPQDNKNKRWIKEEIISHGKYKNKIKNESLDNIEEVKIIPPRIRDSETKVKIVYKEPIRNKPKTRPVVHDPRMIRMNPESKR